MYSSSFVGTFLVQSNPHLHFQIFLCSDHYCYIYCTITTITTSTSTTATRCFLLIGVAAAASSLLAVFLALLVTPIHCCFPASLINLAMVEAASADSCTSSFLSRVEVTPHCIAVGALLLMPRSKGMAPAQNSMSKVAAMGFVI